MPRLVLLEDDGRELLAADISRQNVRALAFWLRSHSGVVQAAAATARIVREALGVVAAASEPRRIGPVKRSRR
jgi:hypothetical protein